MALQFPTSPTIGQEFIAGNTVYVYDGDSWVVLAQTAEGTTLIQTIVSEGADGTGSGLDADLLDGNDSAYYINYTNQAETNANVYTDAREVAITTAYQTYANQAEADAISTANAYTDTRETAITTAYQSYADQAEADANTYTNARETAITTAYQTYADTAEADAKAYTDARETAITTAYQTYANQAETDAVNAANSYTDAREVAITNAYKTYADTAESDALAAANAYTNARETAITTAYQTYANQAEADAISTSNSYTDTQVSNLISSAPTTLDTLNELAAALGDDPNFATTVTNQIGTKVSKSGDTMTGFLTLSANPTNSLHAATKSYVDSVASGVTGGAVASADKWTTARTVSFATGDVTGAFTIDGSANVSNVVLTVANDSHTHDSRYYTETEVNTFLSGKSNTGHVHDDRYYTETEVDTLLAGKSSTTHTHSYLPLTGGTLTGDLSIQKNNAWITIDSPSTGGNGIEQGAGISIGESGYKGSASLHLTYTGDGYGHIGMGVVDGTSNLPAYEAMTLYYLNNTVRFASTPNVAGSTMWHAGNDGSGSGLDADLLDGLNSSSFLRGDVADTFTSLSGTSITLGSGVTLRESTDRVDLLSISSSTTGWGGLQITNTAGEGLWSFMVDNAIAGIYDDQNSLWSVQYDELGAVRLYHAGASKLATTATGVSITGALVASGDVTAFSDRRFKHDIRTIDNALDTVLKLRGTEFVKDNRDSIGVIAQEVEEVLPQVVHTDEEGLKSVAYGNMVAVLIEAMKEQQSQIEALKVEIENLKR